MNIALLLSGGTGSRVGGDIPKQYIEVNNRPIISYTMEALLSHEMIDAIEIVASDAYHDLIRNEASPFLNKKPLHFSEPGDTRQLSILNGMRSIRTYATDADYIFVHDAARPCLSYNMITECFAKVIGHQGVIPVLPMKDTVYLSNDGQRVTSLLDRSHVFAGQAPELFILGPYYDANQELLPDKIYSINGSTEPAILAGMDIAMIPGDEANFKITTPADLERFKDLIL